MRLWKVLQEMHQAVTGLTELRLLRATGTADRVPDTYAEFLLLTSAAGLHEPSAWERG